MARSGIRSFSGPKILTQFGYIWTPNRDSAMCRLCCLLSACKIAPAGESASAFDIQERIFMRTKYAGVLATIQNKFLDLGAPTRTLKLSLLFLLCLSQAQAQFLFVDNFNRPDGAIANGWTSLSGSRIQDLQIKNNVVVPPIPAGIEADAGIWRPVDHSQPVTVSMKLTTGAGYGGLRYRYTTNLWFGSNGAIDSWYGLFIYRADEINPSYVTLRLNGVNLVELRTSFQYGASIAVVATYYPDGRIAGTVSGDGNSFQFDFGPRSINLPGGNVAISMYPSDYVTPTLDDVSILSGSDSMGPITSSVSVAPNPIALNVPSLLSASIDDSQTGGSNVVEAAYRINGGDPFPMVLSSSASVAATASANLTGFAASNVYTICVRGRDSRANLGEESCVLLPVYDPDGPFTTGGGRVYSPAGADAANPNASGYASFGFVSKYKQGQSTPQGSAEFQFRQGDLNFKSTSMDWLVVTGEPRSIFRGSGTINGSDVCKFELEAWDGSFQASNVDAFGLKIFACANGGSRYNLTAQPLLSGNIMIHKN
jgi:hypothetical protein